MNNYQQIINNNPNGGEEPPNNKYNLGLDGEELFQSLQPKAGIA